MHNTHTDSGLLSWLGLWNTPTAALPRGKIQPTHYCPGYYTKQSDGEASVMLELLGMWCTLSLPSLPSPFWLGVVAADRVLSICQIELNSAQRLSLWENWVDERGCDEGHWHAHTRGLQWGLPGFVGTVQHVHYSRRRLLQRGLEFHVCTINKSAHTKTVWKLI